MYVVQDPTGKERTIKRLSKYEKRIIFNLMERGSDVMTMRELIGMPHRSSMSRVIKTLECKGLILTRPRQTGGEYTKRISLTPAGERVGDRILDETPIGELIDIIQQTG